MESNRALRVAWRCMRRILASRTRACQDYENVTEEGFTLIELMVVLLIMGILMAIAIPTFLGATSGANDRAAQSNLTNLMISAKTVFTQSDGSRRHRQ
jgi:prepilin-type N-terminal cleavage/methylation domain-containing protein